MADPPPDYNPEWAKDWQGGSGGAARGEELPVSPVQAEGKPPGPWNRGGAGSVAPSCPPQEGSGYAPMEGKPPGPWSRGGGAGSVAPSCPPQEGSGYAPMEGASAPYGPSITYPPVGGAQQPYGGPPHSYPPGQGAPYHPSDGAPPQYAEVSQGNKDRGRISDKTMAESKPGADLTETLSVHKLKTFRPNAPEELLEFYLGRLCLSAEENNIYITDFKNESVKIFDIDGHYVSSFNLIKSADDKPVSITRTGYDTFLIGFLGSNNCVQEYDVNGCFINRVQLNVPNKSLAHIGINKAGQMLVGDVEEKIVTLYSPEGNALKCIDSTRYRDDLLNVHVDKRDYSYVTTFRDALHVYDDKHHHLFDYKGTGKGQFGPVGTATDSQFNILIAERVNHRVDLVSSEGVHIKYLLTGEDGIWTPMDLAMTSSGKLIVMHSDAPENGLSCISVFQYM